MSKVQVEFYIGKGGRSPVQEFIDKCPAKTQVKILRQLQYLQEFGLTQAIPNCKKLTGTPLWELRILGRDNVRLFYAMVNKDRVVVLHAFSKKTQKTPARETDTAWSRYREVVDK